MYIFDPVHICKKLQMLITQYSNQALYDQMVKILVRKSVVIKKGIVLSDSFLLKTVWHYRTFMT